MLIFALLIPLFTFVLYCDAIQCGQRDGCRTNNMSIHEPLEFYVECDECAGWACLRSGIIYAGMGCKGDANICNDGEYQNGNEYQDDENCFVTCYSLQTPFCAHTKLIKCSYKLPDPSVDANCIPNKVESNKSVLKVIVIAFIGWILIR